MKQALYILRHPIYGVWEMKRKKTGRYRDGLILILLAIAAVTFVLLLKTKLHPIILICGGAVVGLLVF